MEFEELKGTIKDIDVAERRTDNDNYLEVVIVKRNLAALLFKLDTFFGPVACTGESVLASSVRQVIKEFGGLTTGQTLYFYEKAGNFIFVMLWPWHDGEHITLKFVRK